MGMVEIMNYLPGTRLKVFDSRRFIDDVSTPLSMTMRPATVMRWYGALARTYGDDLVLGPYQSLIDVKFDGERQISHGHITNDWDEPLRGVL